MKSLVCLVLLFCTALYSRAAELAHWEAGSPNKAEGLSLVREKDANWNIEKQAGAWVASIVPVSDYYSRAAFVVRTDKVPAGPVWLTIEYLDRGFGLISISHDPSTEFEDDLVRETDQWGVARLNTGKLRRAQFRLEPSAFARPLRIYGLDNLSALRLTDSEPARAPVPKVLPAVNLQRPVQLVMGELADVRKTNEAEMLASLDNYLPLVRALGFNAIESYVKWGAIEKAPGVFDWSYYDATVAEAQKYDLKWFPPIMVGPAYTLPAWFYNSPDHLGFECLEHHERTEIQTIFSDTFPNYVQRFLSEFGKHYGHDKGLLGVRTGVSGTYGEALYPAGDNGMGYQGKPFHSHNGYWAAGNEAVQSFRAWLRSRYPSIAELDKAWAANYGSFDEVETFLPETARTSRQRLDFCNWYMDSMSDWTDRWAGWIRAALPGYPIYHSEGGHGEPWLGGDYSRIARDAAKQEIGLRVTNENDVFAVNFAITRMASSAARFYGIPFALEPAGASTARGVMARLFGALVTGADQLFYYAPNLFANDQAVDKWIRYAPLLDQRAKPLIDVAVFYPDTADKLDDAGTALDGPFYNRVYSLRSITDHDFVSEQMILDGALDRYKVLVFLAEPWGITTEKPVLDRIAKWVEAGGTVIRPTTLETVEGDTSITRRWERGDTGKGRVTLYLGDFEPVERYLQFVRRQLLELGNLHPAVERALLMEKPETVYWSVLENGKLALLNYGDQWATVRYAGRTLRLEPYGILLVKS